MAILYVAAQAAELDPFSRLLEGTRKLNWPLDYAREGILDGRRLLLVANGAGPRLALRAMEVALRAVLAADLSSSLLEAVVSTGFCGALSPALLRNNIVVAESVLDQSTGQSFNCELPYTILDGSITGALISQDRIANDSAEKSALGAHGAIAVDMEAAAVAGCAQRNTLPFLAIKVVSDRADESFPFDLNSMRDAQGRIAYGKISKYALTRPQLWAELFRWKRRADQAAKELGEFLANCRIKSGADQPLAD